jgi:hypothetical protein
MFPPFEPERDEHKRRQIVFARGQVPVRVLIPNMFTLVGLCAGLTAIRMGIESRWDLAVAALVFAALLDGIDGRIARLLKASSRFGAELDKASDDNERQALVVETQKGESFGLVLIAGLIARRIVTFVGEGASVATGERIGLIRFGSRVDVYLPAEAKVLVRVGQTAIGGETVLAELPLASPARETNTPFSQL